MKADNDHAIKMRSLSWLSRRMYSFLPLLIAIGIATGVLQLVFRLDQGNLILSIALGICLSMVLLSEYRLMRRTKQLIDSQQTLGIQQRVLRQKLRTSLTAAAVAHEVNQPLSSLSLISQRLIDEVEELPQLSQTLPLLQVLFAECQRLVELIEKMRMLLQSVETDQGPVDLVQVIGATLTYLNRLVISEQVSLEVTGIKPGFVASIIYGDGAQLQVAITNLIRNSLTALNQIPVENRKINLGLRSSSDYVEFFIADSGPGFSSGCDQINAMQDRIFTSTRSTGMGLGLGLYLVGATVENHRGTVNIRQSTELGGAEVILRFPLISQQLSKPKPGISSMNFAEIG
jgi:signal transduction histidine kinase